ncbi:hypothetical protein ACN4EE_16325 [Geminocystis sp. CENA526]|uniref:hypothetical protein n=1 Tax=Geminocystis sp. CENA526 TaxID=1355871 RepID=UPI003D6FA021
MTYSPLAHRGLLEKIILKEKLEKMFDRTVDLVSKKAIENNSNWLKKEEILNSAKVIYLDDIINSCNQICQFGLVN